MERALHDTLQSAQDYRKQLETVLTRSNDAIAQVQEGILVEANQSWLELIGAPDATDIIGQPVMDLFEESNHVALKGALSACRQGRWSDHSLRADLRTADGSSLSLELVLTLGERDGEPCVRMIVPSQRREEKQHRLGPGRSRAAQSAFRPAVPAAPAGGHAEAHRNARAGRQPLRAQHRARQLRAHRARAGCVPQRAVHLRAGRAGARSCWRRPTSSGISAAPACWP